jgi:hypothetical protein
MVTLMNDFLTEQMYDVFPALYRGRTKSPQDSAMCWGFECGDGWYQILYDLSLALHEYALRHPELSLEVMQVKSKFGTLRIHLNQHTSEIDEMISHACQQAEGIDEDTGKSK